MQALVGGCIEGHTLATGDTLICHDEGRYVYTDGNPHLFPYSGFDLSGLEATPLPEGGAFVTIPSERAEEVMNRKRIMGVIDIFGPCFVSGTDEDGEPSDIDAAQAALLSRLWTFCNR